MNIVVHRFTLNRMYCQNKQIIFRPIDERNKQSLFQQYHRFALFIVTARDSWYGCLKAPLLVYAVVFENDATRSAVDPRNGLSTIHL